MYLFRICNINYRVVINEEIDVLHFAKNNWNCTIGVRGNKKCKSMMYYNPAKGFGANVFKEGKINFFTTVYDPYWVRDMVVETFCPKVDKSKITVKIVNIVLDFDLKRPINLDQNFLGDEKSEDIFSSIEDKMPTGCSSGESKWLDRQSFPALIVTPFANEKKGINVYSSGKLTSYGLNCMDDIKRFKEYVYTKIV